MHENAQRLNNKASANKWLNKTTEGDEDVKGHHVKHYSLVSCKLF